PVRHPGGARVTDPDEPAATAGGAVRHPRGPARTDRPAPRPARHGQPERAGPPHHENPAQGGPPRTVRPDRQRTRISPRIQRLIFTTANGTSPVERRALNRARAEHRRLTGAPAERGSLSTGGRAPGRAAPSGPSGRRG